MLDKEKVKELFRAGYKAGEIAKMLGEKQENIRQCIHRNFKHHKIEHRTNRERDKEILRVTMREAKTYMSDADFIKRNRSIYRTKENGDVVVKQEAKSILPFDAPRRLINENKCTI